jgi:hypothetical protein
LQTKVLFRTNRLRARRNLGKMAFGREEEKGFFDRAESN